MVERTTEKERGDGKNERKRFEEEKGAVEMVTVMTDYYYKKKERRLRKWRGTNTNINPLEQKQ